MLSNVCGKCESEFLTFTRVSGGNRVVSSERCAAGYNMIHVLPRYGTRVLRDSTGSDAPINYTSEWK